MSAVIRRTSLHQSKSNTESTVKPVHHEVESTRLLQTENRKIHRPGMEIWTPCCCGTAHPPFPHLRQMDPEECLFYWQIGEYFPEVPLSIVMLAEARFFKLDSSFRGRLDMEEFRSLIFELLPAKSATCQQLIAASFKRLVKNETKALDFFRSLAVVQDVIEHSPKADAYTSCSIQ